MEEGAITAGNAGKTGNTGADNTGKSCTMTWEEAVLAAVVVDAAADVIDGAAFESNAMTKSGLKNPRMLESSTCRGGMMLASPPASEDVGRTSGIDTEGAELGCKKFCKGFPPPTPGAKFEEMGLDNKACKRA